MARDASRGLLGAVTLEESGLRVDLIAQRLIPVKTYLTECRALHRAAPHSVIMVILYHKLRSRYGRSRGLTM